jgi:oligosaccharide reducing-end xylanase
MNGHGDFFSDAYRVALNIGVETLWTGGSPATDEIALKICSFFDRIPADDLRAYKIDGTPLAEKALHPVGLIATNAAGAIAASRVPGGKDVALRAIVRFMETPIRTGERRYYDNCLYFFALLALSGRYRAW